MDKISAWIIRENIWNSKDSVKTWINWFLFILTRMFALFKMCECVCVSKLNFTNQLFFFPTKDISMIYVAVNKKNAKDFPKIYLNDFPKDFKISMWGNKIWILICHTLIGTGRYSQSLAIHTHTRARINKQWNIC